MTLDCAWNKTRMNTAVGSPESVHSFYLFIHTHICFFVVVLCRHRGRCSALGGFLLKVLFRAKSLGCTRRRNCLFRSFSIRVGRVLWHLPRVKPHSWLKPPFLIRLGRTLVTLITDWFH